MPNFVQINKLAKTYETSDGPVVALENFSLTLARGEVVSVLGQRGSAKSTLLSSLAGFTPITSGKVIIANREVGGGRPDRDIILQTPLMPWMSAVENVLMGVNQVYRQGTAHQCFEMASQYLKVVGLGDQLHTRVSSLCAAMQRRVGLARAIALQPKMLLLDEPFAALEPEECGELRALLLELLDSKTVITAMFSTENVEDALCMSDRVVVMTKGPRSRVAAIYDIPFGRPRTPSAVLEHAEYVKCRREISTFLEGQILAGQLSPQTGPENEAGSTNRLM